MSTSVNEAIFARWNAAGLNLSVATLFPGGDDSYPGNPEIGPPTELPRAEYDLDDDIKEGVSKGSIVFMLPLEIIAWGTTEEQVRAFQDLIETAFNNADRARTGPMVMESQYGRIMGVMLDGRGRIRKVDDAVWKMTTSFTIRWAKPNGVPN